MVLVNLSLKNNLCLPSQSRLAGEGLRAGWQRLQMELWQRVHSDNHRPSDGSLQVVALKRAASWATGSPVSSVTIASLEFIILEMLTQMLVVMLRRMVTSRAQN